MKSLRKFLIFFKNTLRAVFADMVNMALKGIKDNPDFKDAPVTYDQLNTANNAMVEAEKTAKRNNKPATDEYFRLRAIVEDQLRGLAMYAQPKIGNNEDRMIASGLPRAKEPTPRSLELTDVKLPVAKPGDTTGTIKIHAKKIPATDGILVEIKGDEGNFKEIGRYDIMRAEITGLVPGKLYELRLRYWNRKGTGPASEILVVLAKA